MYSYQETRAHTQTQQNKDLEVMDMFILVVVMISYVHMHMSKPIDVCIKCVHLGGYQFYLHKANLKTDFRVRKEAFFKVISTEQEKELWCKGQQIEFKS